jgi:hypothetical protein
MDTTIAHYGEYSASGNFTDSFGVGYTATGYVDNSPVGYSGGSYYYSTFSGTIGGKSQSVYVSGTITVTGTAAPYTYTVTTSVSANVLEPAASIYIVSYKKAALDASHNFVFRFVGTNTVSSGTSSSLLQSAGFAYTAVYGYPVTDALVTDNAAGDKAKAYDPDLVTYILSVNDFLNGTAAGVPDAFETKEFQFGFQNTQVNHDPSYTWIEQTVRRAAQ